MILNIEKLQNIRIAVDAIVFGYKNNGLYVLLIEQQFGSSEKYWALPGGLARALSEEDALAGRLPRNAMSKDVWVLADRGQTASLLQSSSGALDLSRHSGLVTSRVADHLFWLGRYTERASFSLRLLMRAQLLLNEEEYLDPTTLGLLHELCGKQGLSTELDPAEPLTQDELETNILERLWYKTGVDAPAAVGLAGQLNGLANVAGQLRERLSSGHWRLLNDCAKVLTERLEGLERAGIVERRQLQPQRQSQYQPPRQLRCHLLACPRFKPTNCPWPALCKSHKAQVCSGSTLIQKKLHKSKLPLQPNPKPYISLVFGRPPL